MAIASTPTLLSLDRFAEIMGVNPMHFNGAVAPDIDGQPMPVDNSCTALWYRYAWQANDRVSWEDLAREIANAEQELEEYLGYPLAPRWVTNEPHIYPRGQHRELYGNGYDLRGQPKTVQLDKGKVLQGGQRASDVVEAGVALVFSDDDGDGFEETVTVTVTLPATVTDLREVKIYYPGESGDPTWEIRPARTKSLSGTTCTMTFWSWQFITPGNFNRFPTVAGLDAVNISTPSSVCVATVDVYREYNDFTEPGVVFYWENVCNACSGSSCPICGYSSQNGCLLQKDPADGVVWVKPGTYSATNEQWQDVDTWVENVEPDLLAAHYYAGAQSDRYRASLEWSPMPNDLARAVAYMTVARLEREFCNCGNVGSLTDYLRNDLARNERGGVSYTTPFELLENPLGTRRGEVMAFQLLKQPGKRVANVAVI